MRDVAWAISGVAACVIGVLLAVHARRSRDRFFVYFAAAFFALGASSGMLVASEGGEGRPEAYVVRLLAFVLIIVAIVDKNRPPRGAKAPDLP